jgi:hypothetical protein
VQLAASRAAASQAKDALEESRRTLSVHPLNVPPSQKIDGPKPCATAGRAEAINIATITTHTLKIKGVPPDSLSTCAIATPDGPLSREALPRPRELVNVLFVLYVGLSRR